MYYIDTELRNKVRDAIAGVTLTNQAKFFKYERTVRYLDGLTAFVAVFYELGASIHELAFEARRSRTSIYRLLRRHYRIIDTDSRYRGLFEYARSVAEQILEKRNRRQ